MDRPPREPVNGWIHFGGAILAILGLVTLLVQAQRHASARHVAAAAAFGVSAVLMSAASALYHLRPRSARARLYQRLDHAAIYLFIAGTYTPVCLVALWPGTVGRVLLSTVWVLASADVLLEVLAIRPHRGVETAAYLGLGWVGVLAAPALARVLPSALVSWLLVGGLLYSVGDTCTGVSGRVAARARSDSTSSGTSACSLRARATSGRSTPTCSRCRDGAYWSSTDTSGRIDTAAVAQLG